MRNKKTWGWIFILILWPLMCFGGQPQQWETYKNTFISEDGRVIDFSQDAMSHSEGQGYGMLLALMHNDRATFDQLVKWSTDNLQVRQDALFAWAWGRRHNGCWAVIDYNNATDGDILIAFALAKAAIKWRHEPYKTRAQGIISDIRTQLVDDHHGLTLLLPGYYGFKEPSGVVVNTGYLILPAFACFAAVDDPAFWKRICADSVRLLEKARFSKFKLPADWVRLQNGDVSMAPSREPCFGYEAIRLPLYLLWTGNPDHLEMFSDYLRFVFRVNYLPDGVNLEKNTVSMDRASAGFYAVLGRCAQYLEAHDLSRKLLFEADQKITKEIKNYYSHTLYLLSKGNLD